MVQASEAYLKYDAGAATDVTKTDAPYFCNNVLHSLFSDCTVSANGLKNSNANGSTDDFVIISDYAGKSYKVKVISANLYVRKMTLNDHVVSANEKLY